MKNFERLLSAFPALPNKKQIRMSKCTSAPIDYNTAIKTIFILQMLAFSKGNGRIGERNGYIFAHFI